MTNGACQIFIRELDEVNGIFFFIFSYLQVEKVLFLVQIFEVEILMDLHDLGAPVSENHIFSGWSVCFCVCVCEKENITQKQIMAES